MRQVFEKELIKFDQERVMTAWDGLIARQQAALEKLNVPAMFTTSLGQDREVGTKNYRVYSSYTFLLRIQRQQRVIKVLEGILGPEEDNQYDISQ